MKVIFFEPFTLNVPHYGTCLELMIEHLKAADEVFFIGCDAELTTCDINISHRSEICLECKERKFRGLKILGKYGNVQSFNLGHFISESERNKLNYNYQFKDIEEVKETSFEDFTDIGFGVASSIISAFRDPYPDTIILSDQLNQFFYSSKLIYKSLDKAVQEIMPDRVYAYNGRYSILRPALRICKKHSIDIFLHEAGSDLSKYLLTKNNLLHDVSYMQKLITDFWNNSAESDSLKRIKANEFFAANRKGISKTWHSYTDDHVWTLPSNWNSDDYNIVIFTSSEDEFAAIGDSWKQPIYKTQDEGIREIAKALQNEKNIKIWVRLHPNLKTAPPKLVAPYEEIDSPNVNLILPHSLISSYLLMENADKVVTFGSSVGIEAAYWGKISILLGMSFYKGMGAVHEAQNHDNSISLILDRELKPLDNMAAIKYGYYFGNFGIPYKHFKKTGIFTGTIEDWDFNTQRKQTFLQKVKKRIKQSILLSDK